MKVYPDRFSVDVPKRAARVRRHELGHILKELAANSLDAGASRISLSCSHASDTRMDRAGNRAFEVTCEDNGAGCADPEVLRRVGSTTSDTSPGKRGRFGHGLIDVIAIAERAEIRTQNHRLVFDEGCTVTTTRAHVQGMSFHALLRHPGDGLELLDQYFAGVILTTGLELMFNGRLVEPRVPLRSIPGVKLRTTLFDPRTERVTSPSQETEIQILDKFTDVGMIYELGIPVEPMPWSLPYDVNVMQKTPLDTERLMLPVDYKDALIFKLVGPVSDLYEAHLKKSDKAPAELRDVPKNAEQLSGPAQAALIRSVVKADKDKVARRNPLDPDDQSESQELETLGFVPVHRNHLPAGVSHLLADTPTVAELHDKVCKPQMGFSPKFPSPTPRQEACMRVFSCVASGLLDRRVGCTRFRGSGPVAVWQGGAIGFNIDHRSIWDDPLGDKTVGIILHECAHAKVSGHAVEFAHDVERLGGKLANWVASHGAQWAEWRTELYGQHVAQRPSSSDGPGMATGVSLP